jgi:argininosuccinate lyase
VTDRDFAIELTMWVSLLMVHLSKFGEDLIVYGTQEFGFVKFADAYSTGSSLMPQKKNPDALELLRGKSGRAIGNAVTMLVMMKGLPTAYNKDMQEDKQALFDSLDTAEAALQIASGVLSTLTPNEERMRGALNSFMLATDLSEYLVRKGVPFRETHHISGRAVQLAEERGCALTDLSLEDLKKLHPLFTDDVMAVWDYEKSTERKDSTGGTSKRSVLEQADKLEAWVNECQAATGAGASGSGASPGSGGGKKRKTK